MAGLISKVYAQTQFTTPADQPACLQALEGVYSRIISVAFWAIGIAAFFAIVGGGFKYMTGGGDEKAITSARQSITYGIAGLVLAVSCYAILLGFNIAILKLNIGPLIQFTIPGTCP